MIRAITYLILTLIFAPFHASAQYWSKRYDLQHGNEQATQVIPMDDGLLVHVTGLCDQNKRVCGGFLKLDMDGDLLWKSIYWDTLETNAYGSAVILDDTIFLNVNYYSDSLYYSILAFDIQGNYASRRDYGFPSMQNWARNISANTDRIYVLYQYQDNATLKYRGRLRAYDRDWILLWEREYPIMHNSCSVSNVAAMPDGGAALIYSGIEGHYRRAVVVRYDKNGEQAWVSPFSKAYDGQFVLVRPSPDGQRFSVCKKLACDFSTIFVVH